jgi:hypothetical protein
MSSVRQVLESMQIRGAIAFPSRETGNDTAADSNAIAPTSMCCPIHSYALEKRMNVLNRLFKGFIAGLAIFGASVIGVSAQPTTLSGFGERSQIEGHSHSAKEPGHSCPHLISQRPFD